MYRPNALTLQHVLESGVSDGEQVRWHFQLPLATVLVDDGVQIDGQTSVGVHSYAEKAGVSLQGEKRVRF